MGRCGRRQLALKQHSLSQFGAPCFPAETLFAPLQAPWLCAARHTLPPPKMQHMEPINCALGALLGAAAGDAGAM